MIRFCLGVSLIIFSISCAQKPTKVFESQDVNTRILQKQLVKPIQIRDETVLVDSRAPFEYAVSHLPQAVNLQWTEFVDLRGRAPGLLKTDLTAELRRLALLGIDPKSEVVILGTGLDGSGEAGRLAWTLLYLGVENIQVAEADSLGLRYSNIITPPKENAKPWSPAYRRSILADKDEVKKIATSAQEDSVHILDVRSTAEYFSKNRQLEYEMPDLRAIHIEWKEFYTHQGRPNLAIRDQLRSVNVKPNDRIVVISNNGVRSGAVAYALLSLGYKYAANYAGGYTELLNIKRNQ